MDETLKKQLHTLKKYYAAKVNIATSKEEKHFFIAKYEGVNDLIKMLEDENEFEKYKKFLNEHPCCIEVNFDGEMEVL